MALMECPECQHEVSSYALACPHCGFPVAASLRETVEELTGSGTGAVGSKRRVHAAQNIARWAEHYTEIAKRSEDDRRRARTDRVTKLALGTLAVLIVVLQLIWIYSAVAE